MVSALGVESRWKWERLLYYHLIICAGARKRGNREEVPVVGLEPTSPYGQQFLRLSRIPFRHTGQPIRP